MQLSGVDYLSFSSSEQTNLSLCIRTVLVWKMQSGAHWTYTLLRLESLLQGHFTKIEWLMAYAISDGDANRAETTVFLLCLMFLTKFGHFCHWRATWWPLDKTISPIRLNTYRSFEKNREIDDTWITSCVPIQRKLCCLGTFYGICWPNLTHPRSTI